MVSGSGFRVSVFGFRCSIFRCRFSDFGTPSLWFRGTSGVPSGVHGAWFRGTAGVLQLWFRGASGVPSGRCARADPARSANTAPVPAYVFGFRG
jgi:hypothetical protein